LKNKELLSDWDFEKLLIIVIKQQLRKYYLSKRKAISAEEMAIKSQQIKDLFFANFDLSKVKNLHIFLPIIKHNEINTWLIIKYLQQNFPKINIVIPKIIPENSTLEHYRFDEKKLIENHWGILEPWGENQVKILPEQIDLGIIPLLIFDKKGNRVGYGKGFYDRFLQECKPEMLKIGVCLEEAIELIEDTNEFDIKMDFCITPNKIYRL
jgi:5-formyltetrahydrofolate cyclo-ligase